MMLCCICLVLFVIAISFLDLLNVKDVDCHDWGREFFGRHLRDDCYFFRVLGIANKVHFTFCGYEWTDNSVWYYLHSLVYAPLETIKFIVDDCFACLRASIEHDDVAEIVTIFVLPSQDRDLFIIKWGALATLARRKVSLRYFDQLPKGARS